MRHTDLTTEDSLKIVVGADVTMTTSRDGIALYAPAQHGRKLIGRFASPAAAWEALDALDAPLEHDAGYRAA